MEREDAPSSPNFDTRTSTSKERWELTESDIRTWFNSSTREMESSTSRANRQTNKQTNKQGSREGERCCHAGHIPVIYPAQGLDVVRNLIVNIVEPMINLGCLVHVHRSSSPHADL
jgi:hypothetical protein